jgi:hypothetical protein
VNAVNGDGDVLAFVTIEVEDGDSFESEDDDGID